MFHLCLGCWKSRGSEKFKKTSKGNISQICLPCYKDGRRVPEFEFKKSQEHLPIVDRLKFCNACDDLKKRSDFYPKSGSKKQYGEDPRSNICAVCDVANQQQRKDPLAKSAYDKKRYPTIRAKKKEYDVRYNQLPHRKLANSEQARKRKAQIKNQEHFLPTNFFELALAYYGEVCMKCGSTEDLTYDHIIPVNAGRICDWSFLNLQILCQSCNSSKSDHFMFDYRPMDIGILSIEGSETIDILSLL